MAECAVPGCSKRAKTMGWCSAHYERCRTTGDVQADRPIESRTPAGGPCPVPGCDRSAEVRGLCTAHYQRRRKDGDPRADAPLRQRSPKRAVPGYVAAHIRVRSTRGSAASHTCVDCGGPALHWSYRDGHAGQCLTDELGLRYSLDPADYDPRCVPCHSAFDARNRP